MVRVHIHNIKHIIIANIYKPPQLYSPSTHYKTADMDIQYITNIPRSVPTGEMSAHSTLWHSYTEDHRGQLIADVIISNSDHITLNTPTGVPNTTLQQTSSTAITTGSNTLYKRILWTTQHSLSSDHLPILVAKSCLEPIHPITVKLQRSNIDSYEAYEMIDATIDRLKGYRNDIDHEFQEWFHAATTLVESAGGVVSQPRVSGRQQHRNNSPAETPEAYYRRNVAIPFLDHLLKEMETRFDQSSRTCSVIFKLIPKLLLAVDDLQDLCDKLMFWRTDLPSPISLLSELKYWKIWTCH